MSNRSTELGPEVKMGANDASAQQQGEFLDEELASLDLNNLPCSAPSQEPRTIKRSAVRGNRILGTPTSSLSHYVQRDLLRRLNRRRLEVTRISFTSDDSQASKGSHGEVVVATLTLDDGTASEPPSQVAVKKFISIDNVDEEKFLRVSPCHPAGLDVNLTQPPRPSRTSCMYWTGWITRT